MATERYYIEEQSSGGFWWAVEDVPHYEQKNAAIGHALEVLEQDSSLRAVRVVKRTERTVWSRKADRTPQPQEVEDEA